jgi:hypothetical protein
MGHYDLGLLVKSECGSSVKCDSVPYELNLPRRDATITQKRASRVCAVYLKATLSGIAIGQTQIVKNCSNSQKLRIWRVFSAVGKHNGEKPRAHDMVEKKWL